MFTKPMRLGIVSILLLALVLAACATAVGSVPSPSQPAAPSGPTDPTPEPSPSEAPSEAPSHEPSEPVPATPAVTPVPTEKPITIVRIDMPVLARVTADGVAIRVLPGLDQPLIEGFDRDGGTVPEVRVSEGDIVAVAWGPIFVDGHTWYAVQYADDSDSRFGEGWVAADFLDETETVGLYPLLRIDGFGDGDAVSLDVTERSRLNVGAVVTPMPGEETCEAELIVIGTDGAATTVASVTATETLRLFGSPLEDADLYQETAGEVTIEMDTDCSWAAIGFVPQG